MRRERPRKGVKHRDKVGFRKGRGRWEKTEIAFFSKWKTTAAESPLTSRKETNDRQPGRKGRGEGIEKGLLHLEKKIADAASTHRRLLAAESNMLPSEKPVLDHRVSCQTRGRKGSIMEGGRKERKTTVSSISVRNNESSKEKRGKP